MNNTAGITYGMDTVTNKLYIRVLAASSATKEELESAKQRMDDGSKTVITEKRPYRPKPTSQYEDRIGQNQLHNTKNPPTYRMTTTH